MQRCDSTVVCSLIQREGPFTGVGESRQADEPFCLRMIVKSLDTSEVEMMGRCMHNSVDQLREPGNKGTKRFLQHRGRS